MIGCQSLPLRSVRPAASETMIGNDVLQRAQLTRAEFLEREVERLRADLHQAEASIVAMESGQRGNQSRAAAVSAIAEVRIALDRVERKVPWRVDQVHEARGKLAEAASQLERGHVGSAVFFASRAERITESLIDEVQQVDQWSDLRLVDGELVNLRAGPSREYPIIDQLRERTPVFPERAHRDWQLVRAPSGQIGWVHDSLLRAP